MFGDIEQVFAASGSCAWTPHTPTCLDCGSVGLCAEASATCESLGLHGGNTQGGDSGASMFATSGSGRSIWSSVVVRITAVPAVVAIYIR
jgi:hypothetical protein